MELKTLNELSRTKTIATVGPASNSTDMLVQLIEMGVDVFRLNMAHGSRDQHEDVLERIEEANQITGRPAAVLIDLAGPKIRLGPLSSDPLTVQNGQTIAFVRGNKSTSPLDLTCTYASLIDELQIGHTIVLADGLVRLQVESLSQDRAQCTVVDGGTFRSRQGVNLPATQLSIPALGDKDRDNAVWAASKNVQYVSLSFVRNAGEILQLKQLLAEHDCQACVVAKIEKQEALENLEEIVQATDAIMVARGDLGVEIAIEKTPLAQKQIIRVCSTFRKPVIVATQMLESMHNSKQPTRAEASDVANAILDGADACMLSGETAIGEYPLDAVSVMQKIMLETEQALQGRSSRTTVLDDLPHNPVADSIVFGAAQIADRLNSKMVVMASSTGEAARLKSKQRDYIRTVCLTSDAQVAKKLRLYWGIVPVIVPGPMEPEQLHSFINQWAKTHSQVQTDDPIVIVSDTELMPGVHDAILVCRIH